MTSIVFCNFSRGKYRNKFKVINIRHAYFVLFDTEITVGGE